MVQPPRHKVTKERHIFEEPCSKLQGSSTVRKLAIFRFARQPRSKLRGMRSLLRFKTLYERNPAFRGTKKIYRYCFLLCIRRDLLKINC